MNDILNVHKPSSTDPSLADGPNGFDRKAFMGRWGVAWSTLPMWKEKRDVVIEYIPIDKESYKKFTSVVEYHKASASQGSKPSTVKGTETLTTGTNGATFDWQGSSWLFFVHSHWEVLGYGKDEESQMEWAVTFFSKTLFTPAGIDVYVRPISGQNPDTPKRQALVDRIVDVVKRNEDDGIKTLSKDGFGVPGVL